MAEETGIEWTDSTFNPWWGCTKISPACDHCYAADLDKRTGGNHWGNVPRRRTSEKNWNEPRRWQKKAAEFQAAHGRRQRVFCASMADVFDNQVSTEWRSDLWALIRECPDLDWLLLTKRPQNIRKMLPDFWSDIRKQVWLGTTVEDQDRADTNIPHLIRNGGGAAVLFLSIEPMLGPINLRSIEQDAESELDALKAYTWEEEKSNWEGTSESFKEDFEDWFDVDFDTATGPAYHSIDWVIAGGESGPQARPSHPDWFRGLRDQCADAGVPFLFKQWGEWRPRGPASMGYPPIDGVAQLRITDKGENGQDLASEGGNQVWLNRAGKKLAGRKLDGVTHDGYPRPAHA